jgi:hypothetical protein
MTFRSRRLATGVAISAVAVASTGGISIAAPADDREEPTIEVVENIDNETRTFGVEGRGWEPNSLVQLELCGNNARAGSVDCVPGVALIVGANRDGVVRGRVSTTPPPSPCPCVVRALSLSTGAIATTPVRVPGVPEMLLDPDDEGVPVIRELAVSARLVDDGGPWSTWLGASPRRTIVLTVANIGNVRITDSILSLTVGRSDPPNGFVEPVPLGDFAPQEAREIEVPVELPNLAWGTYHVHGEISGATDPVTFATSTTTYPWVLIVPAVLAIHGLLLLLRNWIRRRALSSEPPMDATEGVPPIDPTPAPPALAVGAGPLLALTAGERPPGEEPPVGSDLVYVVEINEGRTGGQTFSDVDRSFLERIVHEHHDEHLQRSVYTVLGLPATKRLLAAAVLHPDPSGWVPPRRRGVVDLVAIPPIVTGTPSSMQAASRDLGRWLGDDLRLPVYVAGPCDGGGARAAVRVGGAPDFGAAHARSAAPWVRLEVGVPTVSYQFVLAAGMADAVDGLVEELRADGVLALADHDGDRSKVMIRTHGLDALGDVHDRVADRFPIEHGAVIGLLPLDMMKQVGPTRLAQLGIDPTNSFEYRIIAMAESRMIAAPRPSLPMVSTVA